MPANGNTSQTSTSSKKKKKNNPDKTSMDNTIVEESDQDTEIVTYEDQSTDLTLESEESLQKQVDKNALNLKANQLHLATDRKELMDQYLAATAERDRLEALLAPLKNDHKRKRVSQVLGKHSTVMSLPIGYMPIKS